MSSTEAVSATSSTNTAATKKEEEDRKAPAKAEAEPVQRALTALKASVATETGAAKESVKNMQSTSAAKGAQGLQANAAAVPLGGAAAGLLSYYTMPPHPTPQQIKDLTTGILATLKANGGKSDKDPSMFLPATLTPLQRGLMKAVNGIKPHTLHENPALLAAVRAGFASEGGQQLALAVHMIDASVVGDLTAPGAAALRPWSTLLKPETIAWIGFSIDPALSDAQPLVTRWVEQAQKTKLGRDQLAALLQGSPIRIQQRAGWHLEPHQQSISQNAALREIGVNPLGGIDGLPRTLDAMANALRARGGVPHPTREAWFDQALRFQGNVPAPVRDAVRTAVEHSPTLRNSLLRSLQLHGTVVVDVKAGPSGATASFEPPTLTQAPTIRLQPGRPAQEAASSLIFELSNAAQMPLLAKASREPGGSIPAEQLDRFAARMYAQFAKRNPAEMEGFVQWTAQQRLAGRHLPALNAGTPPAVKARAVDSFAGRYLESRYGSALVRNAANHAIAFERQELESTLMHAQVSRELHQAAKTGAPALRSPEMSRVLSTLKGHERMAQRFASYGNFHAEALNEQISTGHTGRYLINFVNLGLQQRPIVNAAAWSAAETGAMRSAMLESGSAAGKAAQDQLAEAALAESLRGGYASPHALKNLGYAAVKAQSDALAQRILQHPLVARLTKAGGKLLTAAAVLSAARDIGQAIQQDVTRGDAKARATRKMLGELLGGLAGAEIGTAGGAAAGTLVGGTIGSVVPVIGTAVGGFIGGLTGGLLGGFKGFGLGSGVGAMANEFTRKPIDAVLKRLFGRYP